MFRSSSSFSSRSCREPLMHTNPAAPLGSQHGTAMMAALQAQSGQLRSPSRSCSEYKFEVSRLEREVKQLRSAAARAPAGQDVPLRDLIEREINAYGGDLVERVLTERSPGGEMPREFARMAELQRELGSPKKGASDQDGPMELALQKEIRALRTELLKEQEKNAKNERCIGELYKELETMDNAVQQARQEIGKLMEEKDACKAAHSRDISTLESMLKEVMDQNQRLQETLEVTNGKTLPKLTPREINEVLEKSVISDLINGGISYQASPNSIKSGSLSPSCHEPEAEEWEDLDKSKPSVGTPARQATPD